MATNIPLPQPMRPCCQIIDTHFSKEKADDTQKTLFSSGLPSETRLLVAGLKQCGLTNLTVLDVGAGVGALAEQLLDHGARRVVLVDISRAYLGAAASRLMRAGLFDRVQFRQGDFVELAPELDDADIVTLDKVICCYPDAPALIAKSTAKARRYYAASYPRDRWAVRLAIWLENVIHHLRGNPFRAYVHAVGSIESMIRQNGFEIESVKQTFFWRCAVFVRPTNRT